MKIDCMIVDDEGYAVDLLTELVQKTPFLKLVHSTTNPITALQFLANSHVDLVFLDMHMGDMNGIDFLNIAGKKALYILCTAHSNYALQGYEYGVVDYLLKPIVYTRFLAAVQKVTERLATLNTNPKDGEPFLFIKTAKDYKHVRIDYVDIVYIECVNNYVCIHTGTKKHLARFTMKDLEKQLPAGQFIRVHQSFLVPLQNIVVYEKTSLRLSNTEKNIPVSDSYRETLVKLLNINRKQ